MTISNLQSNAVRLNSCGIDSLNQSNTVCIDTNTKSKSENFEQVSDSIIDYPVYVPCDKLKKYSSQSGWDTDKNLIDGHKVSSHIRDGGNVGLILGKWFNGTTYVLFDIEEEGILPENLKAVIDPHTVISQKTVHGGLNRIVRIENKESYELLNDYKTTITSLRDNEEEDLELITNGASPLPPSEISHTNCSKNKPCDGTGTDRYTTVSINPEAPPIGLDGIQRIGDLLELEGDTEPDYETKTIDNVPSPRPNVNILNEYNKTVPSVEDSFKDREYKMMNSNWVHHDEFIQLWHGNFESISGSNKQGKAECKLANYIGFWFGNSQYIIQYFLNKAPFDTYYSKYDSHRKYLLENATNVDWVYCDNVQLGTKLTVAQYIWIDDSISKTELIQTTGLSKSHIERILPILESENMINTNLQEELIIKNKQITESYIKRLDNIAHKRTIDNENSSNDTNVKEVKI